MALWPDQPGGSQYFGIPSVLLLHVVYHTEQNGKINVTFGVRNDHVAVVNASYDKIVAVLNAAGKGAPPGHVLVFEAIKNLGAAIS